MTERIFTAADLQPRLSRCGCLACGLGEAFAGHLRDVRSDYPGAVQVTGHRFADPAAVAVPHLVALRLGNGLADVVVWEEMSQEQFHQWLPSSPARDRVPQVAAQLSRLVAARRAIRAGRLTLSGEAGAVLDTGRYPSFLFFVEYWPALDKEIPE
ncbi:MULTISPECIES: hypothetical protein [Kitasatospora]|uniref:hypothetical protein n=1 Tax=Kitasatospora TaxID=2063 RepID=UPI000C70AB92|nr:hypothetical protein [Kitasatospora sp. GP30]MDH6145856.1 hypothetical protein [Kitasatospora sp. GP30]